MAYTETMLYPLVFGVFGLIIGSFLNVLTLRWKNKPLTGRSSCPSCSTVLAWYDLVPVFSWILLGGKCRTCKSRISIQYPIVESATALAFLLIALSPLPILIHALALPIAALLIAIGAYDFRHAIIPDPWVFLLAGLTFVAVFVPFPVSEAPRVFAETLAAGLIAAVPLFFLWLVSRGGWMGFGDVKLALAMGFLLGALEGFFAVMLAFILGAVVSVPLLFLSSASGRRMLASLTPTAVSPHNSPAYTMKSEIPFGPFLIAATFIVWLSNMHGILLIELLLRVN